MMRLAVKVQLTEVVEQVKPAEIDKLLVMNRRQFRLMVWDQLVSQTFQKLYPSSSFQFPLL